MTFLMDESLLNEFEVIMKNIKPTEILNVNRLILQQIYEVITLVYLSKNI